MVYVSVVASAVPKKPAARLAVRKSATIYACLFTITGHHVVPMKIDGVRFFFAVVATAPITTNSILPIDNVVKWRTE